MKSETCERLRYATVDDKLLPVKAVVNPSLSLIIRCALPTCNAGTCCTASGLALLFPIAMSSCSNSSSLSGASSST